MPILIPCPPVIHAIVSPVARIIAPVARHIARSGHPVRHLVKRVGSHLHHPIRHLALPPAAKTGCQILATSVLAGGLLVPPTMTPTPAPTPQVVIADPDPAPGLVSPQFTTAEVSPAVGPLLTVKPQDPSLPPTALPYITVLKPSAPSKTTTKPADPKTTDPFKSSDDPVQVPEPSSIGVLLGGLAGLMGLRWRRHALVRARVH